MNHRKKKSKKQFSHLIEQKVSSELMRIGNKRMTGRLSDPSGRGFPPPSERKRFIESIRAIPSDKRTPFDWYILGSLLVYDACLDDDDSKLNEGNEAIVIAVESDPPVPEAILDLVWLLNLRGLPAMSLQYARKATQLMPNSPEAWRFLGNTYMQLKQKDHAIDCLKKAVALPSSTESDHDTLKRLESREDFCGGRGLMFLGMPFFGQSLQKTQELQDEQIKLQLFYARQIVQLMPELAEAQYMAALSYYLLQQYDQAERHLAQLFAIEEKHADGYCMQALIHQKKRNSVEKAAEFYEKTIQIEPEHVVANSNLAKILLDEYQKAREARLLLEAALQADPTYAPAISMYGNTIAAIEHDYKRESDYHAKALKYSPNSPEIRFCYIMSLLQAGEFYQLKKEWRRHGTDLVQWAKSVTNIALLNPLLTCIPFFIDPPSDFGVCVQIAENFSDFLGGKALGPLLQQAWKIRYSLPNEPEICLGSFTWLGVVAGYCKNHELALEAFREAEKIEGKGKGSTLDVAVTLAQLGRFDEAIELANSVEAGTDRATTIQANILRDAGKLAPALEKYLLATIIEPDFELPVVCGIEVAIKLGEMQAVERLGTIAKEKFSDTTEGTYAFAKARLALGFPSESAAALSKLLYKDGMPNGLPKVDITKDGQLERDLSVTSGSDENTMFFTLALSFLKSRQFEELIHLGNWMQEHRTIHGDWLILVAEANRYLGYHKKALEIVDGMQFQPPPLATRALIAASEGDWKTVCDSVNGILSGQFLGTVFFHPEGLPDAVGLAVRSMNTLVDGYPHEAVEQARLALKDDCTCGLAYVSLSRAYEEAGEIDLAIESGMKGLERVPGDPGILEWLILKLIDQKQSWRAYEILSNYRKHIESRGMPQLACWLGEQVALAKLSGNISKTDRIVEPWVSLLEPQSQEWLNAAISGNEKISDLRLGIALYYCKIVERELTSKLIRPFVESRPESNPNEFDRDLKDLQFCLNTGRMPGLGSIAHALGVSTRPGRNDDTVLLSSWRKYLRELPEPQKTAVRSRDFVDRLRTLADVRNRVAHLGDLTYEEFDRVEKAVMDNRQPGLVLKLLGIQ
jgi:tetratricopeptide (TPR) repeat protein